MKTKIKEFIKANQKVVIMIAIALISIAVIYALTSIGYIVFTGGFNTSKALVLIGTLVVIQLHDINNNLSKIAKK